jgi:hypothetical protein
MLFKDKKIQEQYICDGFVVVKVYDDQTQLDLINLFNQTHKSNKTGLLPSLRFGSALDNIKLHYEIAEIVTASLSSIFKDFDFVANHFITKTTGDTNEFRLHQDWNVVDENKYLAAHIWSPLQPTNQKNGGLFVIRKSHTFFQNYRSGSLGIPFINSTGLVYEKICSVNLSPGEAIIYNQALFHGSYPNLSLEDRNVVLTSIKPSDAPMLYYHKKEITRETTFISSYHITSEILFEQIRHLEQGAPPVECKTVNEFSFSGLENRKIDNTLFEKYIEKRK